MGLITFNDVGDVINQDLIIKLSDIAGVGRFVIKDNDGFTVFSVDSRGNVRRTGNISRV